MVAASRFRLHWFLISLLVHVLCIAVGFMLPTGTVLRRNYLVFGAHSRIPTLAYFHKKKIASPTTHGQDASAKLKEKAPQGPVEKKASAIQEQKKSLPKTTNAAKVPQPAPSKSKKVEPPKKVEKPVAKKQETKPASAQQAVAAQAPKLGSPVVSGAAVRYQQHIQEVVRSVWQPPLGVPKGTEAVLTLELDKQGRLMRHEIVQRSGNLLYDMSVLQALPLMDFGLKCANCSFSVNFVQ